MAQRVIFSDESRADIRAIDRETALRLLKALARFLETDAGNVKQLEGVSATGGTSSANPARMPSRSCASATGETFTAEGLTGASLGALELRD